MIIINGGSVMLKITLSLLTIVILANASDSSRANSAATDALKGLDCEFDDCSEKVIEQPKPKVVVKEKIVYKDKPVEKIIVQEKVVYKDREIEKIVYRDRPIPKTVEPVAPDKNRRIYSITFDIPVIGVTGSSFHNYIEYFYIDEDKVKIRKASYNDYLKTQSLASWAEMTLKNGKLLFLSKYDDTIPYFRENITQIKYHVELPDSVIAEDSTIVSLPKKVYKDTRGHAEEYSSCSFNGFVPHDSNIQSTIKLNGKKYLDIECNVVLYNYNLADKYANIEIQSMLKTESFNFMPIYRVSPPIKKGSKKAILGKNLKKFLFANEIKE